MTNNVNNKEILTVSDLTLFLGIGRATAYKLVGRPDFPKFRIGKAIRIKKDALLLWLDEKNEITN